MAMCAILEDFLRHQQTSYRELRHPAAFTGHQLARTLRLSANEVVKSVLFRANGGRYVVALLPAALRIDLDRLRAAIGVKTLRLASEEEMEVLFPKCDVGAMCPFMAGCSMAMDVYADHSVAENTSVVLKAGLHKVAVRLRYVDFERLLKPTVAIFSVPGAGEPVTKEVRA